jgi:hypothetical protein
LKADATSESKDLVFRLSDVRLLHQGHTREPKLGLIDLKAEVLGKTEGKSEEKTAQ